MNPLAPRTRPEEGGLGSATEEQNKTTSNSSSSISSILRFTYFERSPRHTCHTPLLDGSAFRRTCLPSAKILIEERWMVLSIRNHPCTHINLYLFLSKFLFLSLLFTELSTRSRSFIGERHANVILFRSFAVLASST